MPFIQDYNSFGLDIGDFMLRLIRVEKKGKKFNIVSQSEMPVPSGCMSDGEIIKADILADTIKKLLNSVQGKKIRTENCISVLPEKKTFIKLLRIRAETIEDLPKKLIQEMTKHIPFSIDEIYFDWQLLEDFRPNDMNNVLAGAAPIQTVDSYISALKMAGLVPTVLEIEASAIIRSLFPWQLKFSSQISDEAKIILDIGAARTSLILYDNNVVHFTLSLPISGDEITQKISEKLELDYKKAEKAKILCGLDKVKCKGILKAILTGTINRLIKKIEEIIHFYEEQNGKNGLIKEIILCGGGANLISLDTILNEKFHIPVTMGNPLMNVVKIEKNIRINKNNILSYATAIGLATRGYK